MKIVNSKNGVPIRLPEERWIHITEEHSEMAGYYFDVLETIEKPEEIYEGKLGEMLAAKTIEPGKFIIAIYKEISDKDGFIITSFFTKDIDRIRRRKKIWPR
jgi:hypothetical protein